MTPVNTTEPPETNPARKTRRRGRILEDELLQSAWDELTEKGWRGFTMEGVAARAHSGKASLYARWPSRTALIRAAMYRNAALPAEDQPSIGSLRADLIRGLQATGRLFESPFGQAMRAIIADAGEQPATPADDDQEPIESVLLSLQRAYDRADPTVDGFVFAVPPSTLPAAVINLGPQVASLDFLSNGTASSDYRLKQIVDQIWLPLIAHHARAPTPTVSEV
jgi:AcrR family transcriptional regulator